MRPPTNAPFFPHRGTATGLLILALTISGIFISKRSLAQAPKVSLVAFAGSQIVGLEDNETLAAWSLAKGINRRGEVFFQGGISAKDAEGNSSIVGSGIWIGKPGALQLVARDGQALPGDDSDPIFTEILNLRAFNNRGEVAFLSRIGPDMRTHEATALFHGTPGNLRLVARDGQAAPGFEEQNGRLEFQATIQRNDQTRISLSDTGALAWTASVTSGQARFDMGVWRTQNESTVLISSPVAGVTPRSFSGPSLGSDGSVAFYQVDSVSKLYHWKDSELTEIGRVRKELGDTGTEWMRLGSPTHMSDNAIIFPARTTPRGETKAIRTIWRWKDGTFQEIASSGMTLVPDQLVADSINAEPIRGAGLLTYSACGKHPVDPSRFCQNVLLTNDGTNSRVIAYEGMPFPNEPEGIEIVLNGIPGLIDKRTVVNESDSIVIHLGKKSPEGEIRQAIYRVTESGYEPVIKEGDLVDFGPAGIGTSTRFHLFANTSSLEPFRSLNANDQLLLSVSTEEFRDALVVVNIAPPSPLSVTASEGTIKLEWNGEGILESASQLAGPWVEAENQALSQELKTNNPTHFFRARTSEE